MTFKAFWVEKDESGFSYSVTDRDIADLPEGEVLIDVAYSSLNYKDALSATGNPGVTRKFPHTPGIDAAGYVLESSSDQFTKGQEVLVMGYDLGMNTPGGYWQRIRVPADWVVSMPQGLDTFSSMVLGTAGFTAALAVEKLLQMGLDADRGEVLVTGASGGVGTVAVALLAKLGYSVAAVTGKADKADALRALGATTIVTREEATENAQRPLLAERWAGAVDTVGGEILGCALKSLKHSASVAACGLAASADIPNTTVLPFILRHVNLLGVDSVELPIEQKRALWAKLGDEWLMDLTSITQTLELTELPSAIETILQGGMFGRSVVRVA